MMVKMKENYAGFQKGALIEMERIRDNWVTGKKQYKFRIDDRHSIEMTSSMIEEVGGK
jgi:hypothetical protein